jgi:hypothetical protein
MVNRSPAARWLGGSVIAVLLVASPARAQSPAVDETAKSEAGLVAVELHWSNAEAAGDIAFLDRFLRPQYRSVNVDGTALDKAALIAGANARRGSDKGVKDLAEWRKTHRHGTRVVIDGETAVVTFYDLTLGPDRGITSADMFVYQDHRWQALYSSHTNAGHPQPSPSTTPDGLESHNTSQ